MRRRPLPVILARTPLFDEATIGNRVRDLGRQIADDGRGKHLLLLGILNSSAPFLADLCRAIERPLEIDMLAIRSLSGSQTLQIVKDTNAAVEGRHVVIVDTLVRTGRTLDYIARTIQARGPASLRLCALFDRPDAHSVDITIGYRGFDCPTEHLVGYGLDYDGRYRELPSCFEMSAVSCA